MPDNVEAGDKCQNHESDDDLQGMLRSPFDKELSELCRARAEEGTAQRIRLGQRPFCGHSQTPKNLFAGRTAQRNLNKAARPGRARSRPSVREPVSARNDPFLRALHGFPAAGLALDTRCPFRAAVSMSGSDRGALSRDIREP